MCIFISKVYLSLCVCVCVYIYIYIYIYKRNIVQKIRLSYFPIKITFYNAYSPIKKKKNTLRGEKPAI